jgi:hypothetical protein
MPAIKWCYFKKGSFTEHTDWLIVYWTNEDSARKLVNELDSSPFIYDVKVTDASGKEIKL